MAILEIIDIYLKWVNLSAPFAKRTCLKLSRFSKCSNVFYLFAGLANFSPFYFESLQSSVSYFKSLESLVLYS